jgi:hypothetical protein
VLAASLLGGTRAAGTGGAHDGTIKARVWSVDPPLKLGTLLYQPATGMLRVKIKSTAPADDGIPCTHPANEIVCALTDRAWVPSSDAWIDSQLWFRLEPNGSVAQVNLTDTSLVGIGGSLHNVWGTCFRAGVAAPALDTTAAAPYDCIGRDLAPAPEPTGPAAAMF